MCPSKPRLEITVLVGWTLNTNNLFTPSSQAVGERGRAGEWWGRVEGGGGGGAGDDL